MNRKPKRLYRTIGFAIIILSIGYIVNDQLRKIGNRISGEYLQELISKESKGLYQLDFDKIDLNILRKSVNIQNIELYATPENREDSINAKNIYEAKVSEVNISLESVIRIYTQKELVVDGIEVIDPLVFMTKINPGKKPLKFGRETGELYDVISQYLDLLQINYLKVKSGTVDHSPSNFRLKSIDFNVESFKVSSNRKKKKIFYSEAINLGVNQQSILLPDSIHELSFEGFELSTKDSILNFKNFKINPRKDIDPEETFKKDNQNIYDIDVPTLELKGVNYLKAYEDNFLVVEQVNIPGPQIKIQSVLRSKKQNTTQAENSIGASLLALFDLIQIKDFNIQKGGLNLTLKGDNQQRFLSDNISINLFNIELDSTQREIQNIIHYFENAAIEINDYDYLLPDNLHNIKFKKLNFNTIDSTLLVQNLKVKPSRALQDSTLTQFNLNLPVLKMEGIAHRDIYDNDRIILENLILQNSEITITPPYLKKEKDSKAIITAAGLFKILSPYFHKVNLKTFSLLNSDLNVGQVFRGKSLNIQSYSLNIDSTLQSWHKIADSTLMNGQEIAYNLKDRALTVGTFQFDNNLHSLELQNLNFRYKDLKDQVTAEYLSFRGIELDSILNRQKIDIDSLTLFKPQIELSYLDLAGQSRKGNNWTFPEKPINILLEDGVLNYEIDKFRSLRVSDLNVELNYQNEIKLFQMVASDLVLADKKLKHKAYISKLSLPKNQTTLLLQNLELKPQENSDSLSISLKIPEIRFKDFNKGALIQHKRFEADSMFTKITELNYKGSTDLNQYFDYPSKEESEFSFAIKNGSIELLASNFTLLDSQNKLSQFVSSSSKLIIHNLSFPKKPNQDLIFFDDFTISNKDFTFYTSKKDSIRVRNFNYSSLSKLGQIQTFSFAGSNNNTALNITDIEIKNAKLTDYIENNRVDFDELTSAKTTLNFRIKKQKEEMLPQRVKLPFNRLKIDQLISDDINIKIYHEEKERNYYVRKANLKINTLALDSTLTPKEIHHHIKALEFSGKDYKESFGKHYNVYADDYTFRYPESDFEAHDIRMRSKYGRFEYSEHIEFQNDWFKLDISELKLTNLNVDSLLIKQQFIINKLAVDKGDFTIFRDLNVPHNRDRKVPMPQKVLAEMDFAFSVDTVFVNSDIHIHIKPKESSGIGTMTINIDTGHIFDMRTKHFSSSKPMVLQAKGQLNEKANFKTKVEFPIPSENGEFHFLGNIGPMDLKALNDMLIPLGAIEVRSGYNEEVNINFKGNDDYAEGLMEFRYKNLKIDILDRKTYQSKGFGNNIKTIFANSFVVSSKNPRWFKLQDGNIFFERIKSRSIFNFWAKSLLSGAVSSIGIKKSKEEAKAYYKENQAELDQE